MGEYRVKEKRYKRNTDFIPKFSIDYTKVEETIDKSKSQEYTKDR